MNKDENIIKNKTENEKLKLGENKIENKNQINDININNIKEKKENIIDKIIEIYAFMKVASKKTKVLGLDRK